MVLKKDRILHEIKIRIEHGAYARGKKLPGGLQLAAEFRVSHISVRVALDELSSLGYANMIHDTVRLS